MTCVNVTTDSAGSAVTVPSAGTSTSAARLAKSTLEARQRAHHGVALDRERDADVAGHAEAGAGHREHAFLGQQAHEGHVVVDRRPRKHVERALWLDALIPDAGQALVHEVALLAIGRHVDDLIAH